MQSGSNSSNVNHYSLRVDALEKQLIQETEPTRRSAIQDQLRTVRFQNRLLSSKPTDPDLVAAAQWRPASRIRPLTSLRLYPAYFLAWSQVRYAQIHDLTVDHFERWEACELADLFNMRFSEACHRWEIPLMVRRLKAIPNEQNIERSRLDYYVDLKQPLTEDEANALCDLAEAQARQLNLEQLLKVAPFKTGIAVYLDEKAHQVRLGKSATISRS